MSTVDQVKERAKEIIRVLPGFALRRTGQDVVLIVDTSRDLRIALVSPQSAVTHLATNVPNLDQAQALAEMSATPQGGPGYFWVAATFSDGSWCYFPLMLTPVVAPGVGGLTN